MKTIALKKFIVRLQRFNIDDDIIRLVGNHVPTTRRQMIRSTLHALLAAGESKLRLRRAPTFMGAISIPWCMEKKGGLLGAIMTYGKEIRQRDLMNAKDFKCKIRGTWKLKSVPIHRTIVRQ